MSVELEIIRWAREQVGRPFVWGLTDCATLSLEALRTLTGVDYGASHRGLWSDRETARAHYDRELPSEVLAGFGAVEVGRHQAVLGDVITVPSLGWPEQLHFVLGRHSLASHIKDGVCLLPTRFLTRREDARVWRVASCLKPYR